MKETECDVKVQHRPIFIDETIQLWDTVSISAGMRGMQILIAPDDLIRVTSGTLAELIRSAAQA